MVAKISHGASLYGALAYNHNKVATGAAGILSGNRMISDRLGLPSEDIRLALLSFENYLLANRNTEKPVLHISLSPAPEDRLTDDQLAELADRYMRKMGYGDQPYIAYKHADTHNAHIHIVSVCVDEQGKKISDSYEHRRSMTACRELEADFGLQRCGHGGTESKSGTEKSGCFPGGCPPSDRQHPQGGAGKLPFPDLRGV